MGENYKDNYKNVSLIVLKGSADSGKTTTLKKLIDELIKDGWKEVFNRPKLTVEKLVALKKDTFIIVIYTAGDKSYMYEKYMFKELDKLLKEYKDYFFILVCPCRKENSSTYKCLFVQTEFKNRFIVEKSKNSYDDDKKVKELIDAINQKIQELKMGNKQ